jgi:hypothetical protein
VPLIGDAVYMATGAVARSVLIGHLQVPLWIDLAPVVVGALAGAGVAARQRFDVVGALLLAVVMGLGGGIIRDLLLGLRPVAVTSRYYLPTVAAAALAGFLFTSLMRRFGTCSSSLMPCRWACSRSSPWKGPTLRPALRFRDLHRRRGRRRRRPARRPDRRTPGGGGAPRALECHRYPGRRQRVRSCRRPRRAHRG